MERLLDIHSEIAGEKPGRKHNVEVLNKSAILMLVACWESYVEEVVSGAYKYLLNIAKTPNDFPIDVRLRASNELRESKDPRRVWELAAKGWKDVLYEYRGKQIESFNTPTSKKVNILCKALLNIEDVSGKIKIPRIKDSDICPRLDTLVALRGAIAHKVKADKSITKRMVQKDIKFIGTLAESLNNIVSAYLKELVGGAPWDECTISFE
ncbi:MAG: HEPN domain-containing protein [Candidatus Deferrimicrobium sp.]|nr:HEPN domain-containing protein [Candidatus Deferrimicrobium sp.]